MNNNNHEPRTVTIAETENFIVWKAEELDGETTYHFELGRATIHFFQEEWDEFLDFTGEIDQVAPDENGFRTLEFDNVDVWLDGDDWSEFCTLAQQVNEGRRK